MSIANEFPDNTMPGWTCAKCGAFVYNGQTHSCQEIGGTGGQWNQPSYYTFNPNYSSLLERIARALEELLAIYKGG